MKAGTLKQFLLKKYPTNEYFDCPVPKHHWEVIQEYADDYARIQIENHIKEVKRLMNEKLKDFEGLNPDIEDIIDNTPINLG